MSEILQILAEKKRWVDSEIVEVFPKINKEMYPSDYLTALRTLNHIYVVDQIFRAHLRGVPHGYSATNTETTPTLDDLGAALRESDEWYVQYVATLDSATLKDEIYFLFTDGDRGLLTREQILFHVFDHGTNHRGNIAQIFKSQNIAPPRDLLTKYIRLKREGIL